MKRTPKPVFFIVALLIVALTYTTFFGVYSQYGDRTDTIIRGAKDIRFGIDIRGGVDVTFGPVDESLSVTEEQMENVRGVIEQRLVNNNITDSEVYADVTNKQVIARFPWKSDETEFDAKAAIEELGQTAMLEFHIGDEREEVKDEDGNTVKDEDGNIVYRPTGELVIDGNDVDYARSTMIYDQDTGGSSPVVELVLKPEGREAFSEATKKQYEAGKWVAAICAAPSVFGGLGFLKDRKATSYPGCLDGIPVGEYTEEPVAVDGNVVTSRGVGTAIAFALKLIEVLISKEKADEIAASIVYPV